MGFCFQLWLGVLNILEWKFVDFYPILNNLFDKKNDRKSEHTKIKITAKIDSTGVNVIKNGTTPNKNKYGVNGFNLFQEKAIAPNQIKITHPPNQPPICPIPKPNPKIVAAKILNKINILKNNFFIFHSNLDCEYTKFFLLDNYPHTLLCILQMQHMAFP